MSKKVKVILSGPDCGAWFWTMPVCPVCGREHVHGGGPEREDPRTYLGHRLSHCGGVGYVLEDADPRRTEHALVALGVLGLRSTPAKNEEP